ncbi:MAG: slipin family protein [Verrucomicrobia bacterium]|nr:slipin family protein [Verrucomicrobiota bacterium]MBU4247019.1 slipin family protein [Verrucomicrobiota bacterium]MBU4290331.1 slipin family protein [Verrucomicrobiota bacterium]MBU4429124.1 slipin family protein [Verrucomicrobiota bacterium]MCG2681769.1 slipin family protein [Kiritimatiellia bacterium]
MAPLITTIVIVMFILVNTIKILREYERGVVFRLGRFVGVRGPGLILLIPLFEKMVKVSLRTVALDVPPQDVVTKDNVSVKVNAVMYFQVFEPSKAIIAVEDYMFATSQIGQTTLRSILGEHELDDLLSNREKINLKLQEIIDARTDPWGIKVSAVEVKDVDLPEGMRRALAKQAEAERERRAKVIHADGEFQASTKLKEAADVMAPNPVSVQLRYLQTLTEIATEKNSTIIFPLPMEFMQYFINKTKRDQP